MVGKGGVLRIRQILHAEELLRLGNALGGQGDGAGLLVHIVVAVQVVLLLFVLGFGEDLLAQGGDELVRHLVELRGILALAGDDQGGTGFIDEDGVHLVHNGKGMAPLDQLLLVDSHIVPEVVKAQLVVGAVGDVCRVGHLPLGRGHAGDHQAHGQAHVLIDLAHPLALVLCQVVIDGDDVHAPAGQSIQIGRQNGHQSLALTGFHLGNAALMQNNAADELHRIGPQADDPVRSFPDGRKGLGQQCIQAFAVLTALLEFLGLGLQGLFAHGFIFGFQRQNGIHRRLNLLQLTLGTGSKELGNQSHWTSLLSNSGDDPRSFFHFLIIQCIITYGNQKI